MRQAVFAIAGLLAITTGSGNRPPVQPVGISADRISRHEIPPGPEWGQAGCQTWATAVLLTECAEDIQTDADQAWLLANAAWEMHFAEVGRVATIPHQNTRIGPKWTQAALGDSLGPRGCKGDPGATEGPEKEN